MTDVKSQDKAERLRAALKENLRKRKAQARGRQQAAKAASPSAGTESVSLSVTAERDKPSD
ncbi:hypothetical protein [Microvirga pakistanensis]|uniref:hypothetical protein n=1 Tax=Microvirga pakistanensis TaxID=1682650 RepID=UPI00106C8968|nr:hypothetical protein [Microvirga pakistanensis]